MVSAMTAAPPTQTSDSDLIRESYTRPEVFAALFDRYAGTLYRYVVRRLGPEAADDLVGETFLIAFSRRSSYRLEHLDARPWLFGIITKLISRHRRTEAARYRALRRSPVETEVECPADRVVTGVTAMAARARLAPALAALPARDRDVLLLIAWGDLSYAEAAQALDIPIGTVRSRLNRARRKIRTAFGDADPMHDEER